VSQPPGQTKLSRLGPPLLVRVLHNPKRRPPPPYVQANLDRVEAVRRTESYPQDFAEWKRLSDEIKSAQEMWKCLSDEIENVEKRSGRAKKKTAAIRAQREKASKLDAACWALVEKLKRHESVMRERWRIGVPFPEPVEHMENGKEAATSEPLHAYSIDKMVRVLRIDRAFPTTSIIAKGFEGFDPFRVVAFDYNSGRVFASDHKSFKKSQLKATSTRGKHLCFVVDLSARVDDLQAEIGRLLKQQHWFYRSSGRMKRQKPAREIENFWAIYDHKKMGNISNVRTKLLEKKSGDTSVANHRKAVDSTIQRAVDKAENLIRLAEQQARKT
jgi:hypothetical protein